MTVSEFFSYSGPLATFVAAAVVILAAFRTNTARVWKEEAEAQKARAERLETDLKEIKERLTHIERDNARLIALLTSLDPARLTAMRLTSTPMED
jgi:cytochrome c-type biogenesis protein CcmH/NrfG